MQISINIFPDTCLQIYLDYTTNPYFIEEFTIIIQFFKRHWNFDSEIKNVTRRWFH